MLPHELTFGFLFLFISWLVIIDWQTLQISLHTEEVGLIVGSVGICDEKLVAIVLQSLLKVVFVQQHQYFFLFSFYLELL